MLQGAMQTRIIQIEPLAPAKPAVGAPCNGCGVCCLAEPCPLGALLTGRRTGACGVLRWSTADGAYRCGALSDPLGVVAPRLPGVLSGLGPVLAGVLPVVANRWIAAGKGCDCSLEVQPLDPRVP